ncbi:hypothetical protein GH153_00280 [bacterium]|nr:hypothetical protein [bacterium]
MRKRSLLILFIFSLTIFLCLADYSYSQKKLKVFISEMEKAAIFCL